MHWILLIQDNVFSTWMRESEYALFASLIVHTASMALLLGAALVVDLRLLGVMAQAPLAGFVRFQPVIDVSLLVSIVSGLLLFAAYPAKALYNPLFYVKLALLFGALILTRILWNRTLDHLDYQAGRLPPRFRTAAVASIVLLAAGLVTGKFLAHTAKELLL